MARVEERALSKPRSEGLGPAAGAAPRIVKPPKPLFLRSWFAVILTIVLVGAHVIGWQQSQIDPALLVRKAPDMQRILAQLLTPDVISHDQHQIQAAALQIVGAPEAPAQSQPVQVEEQLQPILRKGSDPDSADPVMDVQNYNVKLTASTGTVAPGQEIEISATGLRPNTEARLIWQSTGTNASAQLLGTAMTDSNGRLSTKVAVPADADRVVNSFAFPNTLAVQQTWNVGTPYLSPTVGLVLERIIETIFLALMGTTLAVVLSIPLSFLASHNLMAHNPIGTAIYYVARTILNVLRSIEVLILAVIFVAAVGIGPFAGVLALTLHSIASLGKLYSEAIESIDPGPIEAITATGANRLQVIMYAVVPQFIPQFISFTLYRWDINVRMSTIIGFVGGGGIGYILTQYIQLLQWHQAGTAIVAIALVVIAMDYASARIRAAVI